LGADAGALVESRPITLRIVNATGEDADLVAYFAGARRSGGVRSYCWQSVRLADTGEWRLFVHLGFRAAGLIRTETGFVLSNQEPALGGRRFRLTQAPREPLRIELAGGSPALQGVRIENSVEFARRTAVLVLDGYPVFGALLDAGDYADFAPGTQLSIALRPGCEPFDVLAEPAPSSACTFDLGRGPSVARLDGRLTRDPVTGAVSCAVVGVPREQSVAAASNR
jgi:hypothetical protein